MMESLILACVRPPHVSRKYCKSQKKKDDNNIEMNKLMGYKMDNLSLNSSTFPYYNSMITE